MKEEVKKYIIYFEDFNFIVKDLPIIKKIKEEFVI